MSDSKNPTKVAVDLVIRIGILLLLIAWCFRILAPFLSPVLWAILLAVALYPLFSVLSKRLGGSDKLSAIILTISLLALILIPTSLFFGSLVEGVQTYGEQMVNKEFSVPPPNDDIKEWPLVGEKLHGIWMTAFNNIDDLINQYEDQIASFGKSVLNSFLGTSLTFFQFILSIIIAGILLATSKQGGTFTYSLFKRIVGERGEEFANICKVTIKNVAKGILGVAIIQSTLAGIGFLLAGIPFAGLWFLISLILGIIQVGPALVIIPVIIYIFSTTSTLAAILWSIYFVIVMLSDNILKPILLGKGAPVPMLIIFLGSIGGFMNSGFVGLFVGAIILSLGYKLFIAWVEEKEASF